MKKNDNLEHYLDLMFKDHRRDIEALEKFDSDETDIVFKHIARKNPKTLTVGGERKKVLYVGNSGFGNLLYKNKKLIIYKK